MPRPANTPAEQVLDNYLKAATALVKVKAVKEWPDGINGEEIIEATEQYASIMRDAVLQRMHANGRARTTKE